MMSRRSGILVVVATTSLTQYFSLLGLLFFLRRLPVNNEEVRHRRGSKR
jgi:hypothetical protein